MIQIRDAELWISPWGYFLISNRSEIVLGAPESKNRAKNPFFEKSKNFEGPGKPFFLSDPPRGRKLEKTRFLGTQSRTEPEVESPLAGQTPQTVRMLSGLRS